MSEEDKNQAPDAGGSADFVLDESGLVLDIRAVGDNARLAAGVSAGETISQYIHPEDREFFAFCRHWTMRSPGAANNAPTIRLRWLRTNGHHSRVYATLRPDESGVRLCLARDEAEQIRRTASQLRRVVEHSRQGIVVRTAKDILFMNDAFAHMLGYESAKHLMSELGGLGPNGGIHPEDAAMIAERIRRRVAGEEPISHYEFRMMHRDGTYRWLDALASLVEWDGQHASLSWMTDVTERKAMEEELVRSKEAAEYASRTKTEFLAHMSHELRTPLNAIIGFAEVIKGEMFGKAGQQKYVDYAKDIHRSGEHLLDLINDILDLSKLEAGKLELREAEVILSEIIGHCSTLVRSKAQQGHVKIVTDIPANLPTLQADERAVKQILLNFLSNAIKFTPQHGVVRLRVNIEGTGGLRIAVSDTGIGMKAEDIEIALMPFGQIDSKIARETKGTGLGLPICKSLLELHGAELKIESELGKGTTVAAIFPPQRLIQKSAA